MIDSHPISSLTNMNLCHDRLIHVIWPIQVFEVLGRHLNSVHVSGVRNGLIFHVGCIFVCHGFVNGFGNQPNILYVCGYLNHLYCVCLFAKWCFHACACLAGYKMSLNVMSTETACFPWSPYCCTIAPPSGFKETLKI